MSVGCGTKKTVFPESVLAAVPVQVEHRGEGALAPGDHEISGDLRSRAVVQDQGLEAEMLSLLLPQGSRANPAGPGRQIPEE